MLNNNGTSQNEAFPFTQFGQPIQNPLTAPQAVFGSHNAGNKRPGNGAPPNIIQGTNQQANLQRPGGPRSQLQQQFAGQQQQYQNAQQRNNPGNSLFGVLGNLNRNSATGAGYASTSNQQGAPTGRTTPGNLPNINRLTAANQQQPGMGGDLDYLAHSQAMQQHGGFSLRGNGANAGDPSHARNTPINNLLHNPSNPHKSLSSNPLPLPSASQPFAKPTDRTKLSFSPQTNTRSMSNSFTQNQLLQKGSDGATPFLGTGLPGPAKAPIGNGIFQSDSDKVFDASEFPALGMPSERDLGDLQGSHPSLNPFNGVPLGPKGPAKALDTSDFPALSPGGLLRGGGHTSSRGVPGLGVPPGVDMRDAYAKGRSEPGGKPETEAERFGLMGLLSVIRMSEPDVTMLSLGIDLQTLGLNLNAADSLHRTFGSPWSDQGRPGALEQKLPSCYLFPAQQLDPVSLQRFTHLSVFFVFYVFAGEEKQLLAGEELMVRGWYYHKQLQVWMKPEKTKKINANGIVGEQGLFKYFDVPTCSIQQKDDMFLDYRMCEERPSAIAAPATAQTGAAQDNESGALNHQSARYQQESQ